MQTFDSSAKSEGPREIIEIFEPVGNPGKLRDFLFDLHHGYDFGVQHKRLRYIASENIDEEASAYNVDQRGERARAGSGNTDGVI